MRTTMQIRLIWLLNTTGAKVISRPAWLLARSCRYEFGYERQSPPRQFQRLLPRHRDRATTAAIAAAPYPEATILPGSFANVRLPEASFDPAIGNVPFGNVTQHDAQHNASGRRSGGSVISESCE